MNMITNFQKTWNSVCKKLNFFVKSCDWRIEFWIQMAMNFDGKEKILNNLD